MNTRIIVPLLTLCLAQSVSAQSSLLGRNLFPEGTFDVFGESRLLPLGWSFPGPNDRPWNVGFRAELVESEAGGKELRLTNPDFGFSGASAQMALPPKIDSLRISYRLMAKSIELGDDDPASNGVGIHVRFHDKDGESLPGASWVGGLVKASSTEWQNMEQIFDVPADAVEVRFQMLLRAAKGEVRLDDVELIPTLLSE